MTTTPMIIPPTPESVAYEYATVRAPRALSSLYQEAYRSFGWVVTTEHVSGMRSGTVELSLERDRWMRNRSTVGRLECRARRSLLNIDRLSDAPRTSAIAIASAIAAGLIGTALLATSIFTLLTGAVLVPVGMGAVGLVGWCAGLASYFGIRSHRTAQVVAGIDAEYRSLCVAGDQAARLLE